MGRKEILNKRLTRYLAKKDDLAKRALESNDANEVRAINAQLADLNEDIEDVRAEIALIEEQEERNKPAQNGAVPENGDYMPEKGQQRAKMPFEGDPIGKTMGSASMNGEKRDNDDMFGSMEYRMAFKDYIQRGTPIPDKFMTEMRATQQSGGVPGTTNLDELGAIIPTTIMNEIIKEVEGVYGEIYSKVRHTNIAGGVKIPISHLDAEFHWISESTVSPRQKAGEINDFVEFSYNMGEIRLSYSLLVSIIALPIFEREVARITAAKFIEAMDKVTINGTGIDQPLGITKDPRVTNIIEFTEAEFGDWKKWRTNLFSVVPKRKRGQGEFLFTASTIESYLLTMQDGNGRPLYYEATGLTVTDKKNDGNFFGYPVTIVEPDILTDLGIADSKDVIGIFWKPSDYIINSNMQFNMMRFFDHDRNQWVNKGIVIVDGKITDTSGCYIIRKK